jgi:hypothetical protein
MGLTLKYKSQPHFHLNGGLTSSIVQACSMNLQFPLKQGGLLHIMALLSVGAGLAYKRLGLG